MIVQQRYWNLNIYLKNFLYFIFNWSVYPLISSTKTGPLPELEWKGSARQGRLGRGLSGGCTVHSCKIFVMEHESMQQKIEM